MRRSELAGWSVAAVLFALGLLHLFGGAFGGGSLGDNSDGGITVATLEHWWRVWSGRTGKWDAPGWYWPAPHTLGLMDSLFLPSLPFGVARALGANPFVADDLAVATLATAGFWGTVALLRRGRVPVAIGAAVAAVFSFGALATFKLGHQQTYTLQLAPALGLLVLAAWRGQGRGRAAWAAAAGFLFGLMLLTAAQTPWFLGLGAALAGAVVVSVRRGLPWRRIGLVAAPFAAGLAAGMVPFAILYRHSFGLHRDFAAAQAYMAAPIDLVLPPPGEWPWSALLRPEIPRPIAEVGLGLAPLLLLTALALLIPAWLARRERVAGLACLLAGLLGPCLAVNWGGWEPWWLVWRLVPGGNAVRTPFRIELAAQLFLLLGVALVLGRMAQHRVAVGALLAALLLEQISLPASGRDTEAMQRWLQPAHRPAFPCSAFYLLPGLSEPWHVAQSDAMLLSQRLGLPTVNGNSSFTPPGWDLRDPAAPDYPAQVLAWVRAHNASDVVCGADPRRGRWVEGLGPLQPR